MSVRAAFHGLVRAWRTQRNFRFDVFFGAVIVLLGAWFRFSSGEWLVVFAVITAMLVLELLNTTVEFLCDLLRPRLHDAVGVIKDVAAAAVLVGALGAVLVGLLVFLPHVFTALRNLYT